MFVASLIGRSHFTMPLSKLHSCSSFSPSTSYLRLEYFPIRTVCMYALTYSKHTNLKVSPRINFFLFLAPTFEIWVQKLRRI